MKRLSIFLLSGILLLSGCSSNSTDATLKSAPANVESEADAVSLSHVDDGTITCEYDDALLLMTALNKTDTFLYGTVFSSLTADVADSITDGSSVYAVTMVFDSANMFYTYPLDLTQSLFDGVFQVTDSKASVTANSDGTYEYFLNQSDSICKGKVFNATDDSISFCVYKVSQNESEELITAFNNCYDSIVFSKTLETSTTNIDEYWDEIVAESEKAVVNSSKITEGDLYDSISSIYPNISINDMGDTISIAINLTHSSYDEDSAAFFYIIQSICNSCQLEDTYSGAVFSLFVDNSLVATLTLTDYFSPTSFKSATPTVFDDAYRNSIEHYYNDLFSSADISNKFDDELNALRDKYNISE